ncbi:MULTISPECIES: hypothetical protein [unclassified Actinopolyspora]|nr:MULTISPECIES: hypothetical protein [unclassified Actinopolyspora]NHE76486.1 hypothetical protein [Actinopolyspora sp. BKK1]
MSTWSEGWTVRESDPGDGRQGRWGRLVRVDDAQEIASSSTVPEPVTE